MEKDIRRLKACLEYEDYYAMLLYITTIIDNYSDFDKTFLLSIQANIKNGNYIEVENILKKL